jgi:DNA-binding response OmpR family regulator
MSRILIVDDEPDVRMALTMLVEEEGHSVIELDDGADVIDFITNHGADLILLDLTMPETNGFQVLDAKRSDDRLADIPVVVVSAPGRPDDRALAKGLGAVDFVNKPWSPGEIEFRIRVALEKAERKWATDHKRDLEAGPVVDTARRSASHSTSTSARQIAPPDKAIANLGEKIAAGAPPVRPRRRVIRRQRRRTA